jgi:AcrR family transcriptional regulator
MAQQTRQQLITAMLDTVRDAGVAGVSARTVAARADVNQALVFYHFGSVDNLLAEACRAETSRRVATYRETFAAAGSLRELLAVGRRLHATEREQGNVTLLAQMLAAAHGNPALRAATRDALELWITEIEPVLRRVLAAGPLDGLLDPAALAHTVSAAFVGAELFEAVDPEASQRALDELDRLGVIAETVDELGPVARRAIRAKLNRQGRRPTF